MIVVADACSTRLDVLLVAFAVVRLIRLLLQLIRQENARRLATSRQVGFVLSKDGTPADEYLVVSDSDALRYTDLHFDSLEPSSAFVDGGTESLLNCCLIESTSAG